MSFLSRLFRAGRKYRQDVTWRLFEEEMTTRNAPPTFVPDIILNQQTNRDDLAHLMAVARGTPLGEYTTFGLAEDALDDWFMLVDENDKEVMEEVQSEFIVLDAKRALVLALAYERIYGYSYLYTGKNRYVPQTPEGARLASLHAFTPEECTVKTYNEIGEPTEMEVTVNVGQGEYTTAEQKIVLPAEDFIVFNTRPIGRGYKGRSALYAGWDMLIYLNYLYHSMCWFDMKIGNGVFTVLTKSGITDELVSKINLALEDISIKRSLVLDGTKVEKLEFIGPTAQATDFEAHIDACLKLYAAATRIPKDVLIGATAGAITGSEVNIKSLFRLINEIQTSIEPYIRELITRMGYNDTDYSIKWNARYAHDEEEQSKIAMNNAQTLAIRSMWLTINELREAEGLKPREEGDMLKADISVGVQGMQTAQEKEKTNNPKGENL